MVSGRAIHSEFATQLVILVGAIFVYDFLKDDLYYFVCGLSQSISLGIVRCTVLVYHRVMRAELPDNFVNEMFTLIADELDGAAKSTPQVFVNKFCCGGNGVVLECFSLDPFGTVIGRDDNIFIACLGYGRLASADKIKPHS